MMETIRTNLDLRKSLDDAITRVVFADDAGALLIGGGDWIGWFMLEIEEAAGNA